MEHNNLIVGDGLTKAQSGNTTTLNVNNEKVLEHDNLLTDYGISKTTSGNTTKLGLEYTRVPDGFDLNTLTNGYVRGSNLTNAPVAGWLFVSTYYESGYTIQRATQLIDSYNTSYVRRKQAGVWYEWREQVGDKSVINGLLAQKQNTLTAGDGLAMVGDTITLKTFDGYRGDLNDLTYTCLAKPVANTPNLPSGVSGNGILSSLRVGDVAIQKYHPFSGNQVYIRSCTGLPNSPRWRDWTLLS